MFNFAVQFQQTILILTYAHEHVFIEKGKEKRRVGEGIIGRLFHRELKDHDAEGNLKDQLDSFDDHRFVVK